MLIGRAAMPAALFLVTSVATAQTPQGPDATPQWLIGMSLGMPGVQSQVMPQLAIIGLQFTQVHHLHVGPDLAIGTMPYLFSTGSFPFGLRGNVTVPYVTEHYIVMPTAGLSGIGLMGQNGSGGVIGVNGGISAVVHSSEMGFRAGITWHQFMGASNPIWLVEVGFVSIGVNPP